ncbi:hypothetical protein [Flavobacterium sp. YJ01]|nr:hypothetical protein [Flavobacterium sp. YJ01]WET04199.1 hypothetical protein P0R33_07620 [Flavobacterium sp. YJ01]
MKVKKPSEMSFEELLKKEKLIQTVIYSLIAMSILLIIGIAFIF